MNTPCFGEADADPGLLDGQCIAVVGFGNQGAAQAQNLRDRGASVLVGNIDDDYRRRALSLGFPVVSIAEAARRADALLLLLPDEIAPAVFEREIRGNLRPGSLVAFASGYCVAFGLIEPPRGIDVVLFAPRMTGEGVRRLFLSGEGFFSFVGVHQDASGRARDRLLALAWGAGGLRRAALQVDFRMEAELDLFNEQAFGPAFGRVMLAAIGTLLDAGYPPDVVLLEMYMSGELGFIFRDVAETGLVGQLERHSQTSQYGAISRGARFLRMNLKEPMRRILAEIRCGDFAREWAFEQRIGRVRHRLLRAIAVRQPIRALERALLARFRERS